MKKSALTLILSLFFVAGWGQTGNIHGMVASSGSPVGYATISLINNDLGTTSGADGNFSLADVPYGDYQLEVSSFGYKVYRTDISLSASQPEISLPIELAQSSFVLNQVVVTGTRTSKRQTESAVIVNVINSEMMENLQTCNLSEGLKFQPGLRVETDCQTCNYTQLRMNGLGGGYSQILINGRPIFSPLTGLYGMEQIPTNMIERIEVVRGGGSALYGSSAIGGTVNVITKLPKTNAFDVGYTYQQIGAASDHIVHGNASIVNEEANAGMTLFLQNRNRDWYDHNGDDYSELTKLDNRSIGLTGFFMPTANQKLEASVSFLKEYRYGGEMVDRPAHLTQQAEERTHRVLIGNVDYQLNFNEDHSSLIAYVAGQFTDRDHYTGIFPDDSTDILTHLANPPYGTSENYTLQGGAQFNHRVKNFLGGSNVLTLGTEYISDDVLDVIEAYNYRIDQTTQNFGVFAQSDWQILRQLNLLAGLRVDKHNFVDRAILSPRLSLLYNLRENTQFRLTYGTGFRAPQAFDADLHIAFAGGGISRISLAENLQEERSQSWSGSINFDKGSENWIAGFTLEGFYTHLQDAFYLHPLGEDQFGERFEKRNGDGATVQGGTLEIRANWKKKYQLEGGFTIQSSRFDEPVENVEGLPARREFLRTPNQYGYAMLTLNPIPRFQATINWVYTGSMELAHFAGAPEQTEDAYKTSPAFSELSFKAGYTIPLKVFNTNMEIYGGIKNLLNAYQEDFDTGKNRDSNYVYGPGMPRTFFAGIRIKSL
ncbi:TonB-dependent receptor [Pontibacter sp. G13]|uniref:TonB-dependent receptor n=1 Tax=Pontibacter sp. G13 TaxID=3074898 RepID=UPI0028891317|nr:TonB-dependent receptor [Pontibacter sp. G13]WNJ20688.1 TonB-dependent receptor [Pontibacter sp. G13]